MLLLLRRRIEQHEQLVVQIASVTALDGAQLAVDEHIAVRIPLIELPFWKVTVRRFGSRLFWLGLIKCG